MINLLTDTVLFLFIQTVQVFGKGNPHKVIAIDCGVKQNIIRNLVKVCIDCFFSTSCATFHVV